MGKKIGAVILEKMTFFAKTVQTLYSAGSDMFCPNSVTRRVSFHLILLRSLMTIKIIVIVK